MSKALADRLRLFRTITEPDHIPDSEDGKKPPAYIAGVDHHQAVEEGTVIRLISRRVNVVCDLDSLSCAVGLVSNFDECVSVTMPLPHPISWLMEL